jgi:hypothetical protein
VFYPKWYVVVIMLAICAGVVAWNLSGTSLQMVARVNTTGTATRIAACPECADTQYAVYVAVTKPASVGFSLPRSMAKALITDGKIHYRQELDVTYEVWKHLNRRGELIETYRKVISVAPATGSQN